MIEKCFLALKICWSFDRFMSVGAAKLLLNYKILCLGVDFLHSLPLDYFVFSNEGRRDFNMRNIKTAKPIVSILNRVYDHHI